MCAFVRIWLCICVLCCLCGLTQNIEFHEHAIPGAAGVVCRVIPEVDANQYDFREICI